MPVLRNADVFVKARADIRTRSTSGGLITLLAASTAFLLFLGQVYVYVFPKPTHTLHLSESTHLPMLPGIGINPFQQRAHEIQGKIPLYFKVTFLHIPCENLGVNFNSEAVHGDDHSGYPKTGESTDTSNNNNNKKNKRQTIKKYKPRTSEYRTIFGSEHSDEAKEHSGKGCTMIGNMRIPIVAGNLAIVMTKEAWTTTINHLVARAHLPKQLKSQKDEESPNLVNTTHYLHEVRFGQKQSNAGGASKVLTSNGYVHPLEHRLKIFENDFLGIGKEEIAVKLIPTLRSNPGLLSSLFGNGNRPFYQVSVVDHMIKPETMIAGSGGTAVPGIVLTYDVTPLAVHIDEDNGDGGFFGFLASLIGIVGGCFVTVGLFAGCAVSSVKAVAKKMD